MYVELDGAWHPIADNEHTPCGLVVPHGTEWTSAVPDEIHCGPDTTVEPEIVEAPPKPGAKKK